MRTIEPSAFWQALQDVDDGQDPADVYERVMNESVDPQELIAEEHANDIEEEHPYAPCLDKHQSNSFCSGSECFNESPYIRHVIRCVCACHEGEE